MVKKVLLLCIGAKGSIGTTVAIASHVLKDRDFLVKPYFSTPNSLNDIVDDRDFAFAGWDVNPNNWEECFLQNRVLPRELYLPYCQDLDDFPVRANPKGNNFKETVDNILADIDIFCDFFPEYSPVIINLLPANRGVSSFDFVNFDDFLSNGDNLPPDFAYFVGALETGIPFVNFTPNVLEFPSLLNRAEIKHIPIAGRDGKTGQTFLKVVLASALKARNLWVDGWYSLNILGNKDGENLSVSENAKEKLYNKTELLNEILGYSVGDRFNEDTHKVIIDYYPPRGDSKEAWDVIDFRGLFDLPMSLRLNLQGRDSILAAPMIFDLSRWLIALKSIGRVGLIQELEFYFKKNPLGPSSLFSRQLELLTKLEQQVISLEHYNN